MTRKIYKWQSHEKNMLEGSREKGVVSRDWRLVIRGLFLVFLVLFGFTGVVFGGEKVTDSSSDASKVERNSNGNANYPDITMSYTDSGKTYTYKVESYSDWVNFNENYRSRYSENYASGLDTAKFRDYDNLKESYQNNPLDFYNKNPDIAKSFSDNGVELKPEGAENIADSYTLAVSRLNDDDTTNDAAAREVLNEHNNLLENLGSNDISKVIGNINTFDKDENFDSELNEQIMEEMTGVSWFENYVFENQIDASIQDTVRDLRDEHTDRDDYNKALDEATVNGINDALCSDTSCTCRDMISCSGLVTSKCVGDNAGSASCRVAKRWLENNDDYTQVETGTSYFIMSNLISWFTLDEGTVALGESVFGLEYEQQPDLSSMICKNKIDGYFEGSRETTVGGVTGSTDYGCIYQDGQIEPIGEKEIDPSCLTVISDLRAQRTQRTPDGNSIISYTSYIRAPESNDITYTIKVAYKLNNGNTVVEPLIFEENNVKVVPAGSSESREEFEPINVSENVDQDAVFKIALIGKYSNSGRDFTSIIADVPLATANHYTSELYDDGDDALDTTSAWGDDGATEEDFSVDWSFD